MGLCLVGPRSVALLSSGWGFVGPGDDADADADAGGWMGVEGWLGCGFGRVEVVVVAPSSSMG